MSLLKLAPATEERESIANALGYADGAPEADTFVKGLNDKVEALSKLVHEREIKTAGQVFRYLNENFTIEEVLSMATSDLYEHFKEALMSPVEQFLRQLGSQE